MPSTSIGASCEGARGAPALCGTSAETARRLWRLLGRERPGTTQQGPNSLGRDRVYLPLFLFGSAGDQ